MARSITTVQTKARDPQMLRLESMLCDTLREVLEDIEISRENVTNQAKEHINNNDLILTYSTSETLL
jgi:translation initiation factor 2B subunit (eIF-2B alpha/beta/delta family)